MLLLLTDGRFNKKAVVQQVHRCLAQGILPLLVIVDGKASSKSIFDLKGVQVDPTTGRVRAANYLEDFPFPFYAVVQDVSKLPDLFSDVLRQWVGMCN